MNKTKHKIILAAIASFNEQGLGSVRNQDIAAKAEISLSNFNYHFATKKDLILAVVQYMQEMFDREVIGNNALLTKERQPLEIGKSYFEFVQEFRFLYLDTHTILQTYPALKQPVQRQIEETIQVIKNLNYMAIGKGYMQPPPVEMPALYDHLAHQMWINNHFWFAQMSIRDKSGDLLIQGLEASYIILYPYLTELGKSQFQAFLDKVKNESNPLSAQEIDMES